MKLNKSKFLIENKSNMKRLVEILSKEFEYVSILATDVTGNSYLYGTSDVAVRTSPDEQRGFCVRVFQDNGFSEYSFNEMDIDKVVANVLEVARKDRLKYIESVENLEYKNKPKDEEIIREFVSEVKNLPEKDNPKEIIEKLSKAHDEVMSKYEKVIQMNISLSVTQVNKAFISTNKDLYQSYAYANSFCMAVAQNEKGVKLDFVTKSGLCGSEIIEYVNELADNAARRAEELLDSEPIESGLYDIICDPDFTGLIAHEAFGHGAEMDMFVKNRAKGQEYLNKRVASDKVFMHDGATACPEVSSYLFDDEGNLGTDTLIIDKGILKTGMCDELSALQLNIEPTGNGKRESYKRKVYTRMTNTFFEGGDDKLEDMISSIEKGYLLEGFSSGMEDPKNWGIQCVAAKGKEIINGKLTGKIVSPVILTGYVPDLLQSITMVSDGIVMSGSGYCGKGWKEWVKTSTGGSYIKAKGRLS